VIQDWKVSALLLFLLVTTAASAKPKVATSAPPKIDHVVVLKRQHKLLLLNGTRVVKTYRVALGYGGLAPKRRQGDGRTPEGSYIIDYRNPESKFHLALHISYPQTADKQHAQRLGVDPGGDIMIHGLPPESSWMGAKHRASDWTNGCIAVTDKEIEEIWKLVPDGTRVDVRR
jgi:murein L,D-transpeptidase YafK